MIRAAARALAGATAVAGIVGVARQRLEARRPELASGPPGGLGAGVGERIAAWQPGRPRTAAGRVLATLWASPLTLPGVALTACSGARAHWDPVQGCLVARRVGGLSGAALAWVGADANTIGQLVVARDDPSPSLLAHELAHVRQGERLGPLLLPAYVWLGAWFGYAHHPLEVAARRVAAGA